MAGSGGGAAVASGASFQARVAAYVEVALLCGADAQLTFDSKLSAISFETREAVDDLNLVLDNGSIVYIQAKASISYSVAENSELYGVLDQFVRQNLSERSASRCVLVTTGRSSKKVIYDLRAALDAFRTTTVKAFKRDQPKALQDIIQQLHGTIAVLLEKHAGSSNEERADVIIKAMFVVALDLEDGATLKEATILLLQASGYSAPRPVWGKLIADALTHAKQRHTVGCSDIEKSYHRFREGSGFPRPAELESELLTVEFGDMRFPTGKEVVLCEVTEELNGISKGLALLELYRFDGDCRERCSFTDESVELLNGQKLALIRRSATLTGMSRLLQAQPEIIGERELTIVPINSDEDFEAAPCAELHRERLKGAALANPSPLGCLHCGKPVSINNATVVEIGTLMTPRVGLVHDACLRSPDRIIGVAQSEFFQKFPELVNFDANGWFKAAHGGQMAFAGAQVVAAARSPILAWGGRESAGPIGDYVVEISLQNGEREIVTQRNAVHRFRREEAEIFVATLNNQFENAREEGDPFCYSDQSKAYGPRSLVLEIVGGKESIRPVEKARVRKFQTEFATRYSRPGQWYAPVMYLVRADSTEPVSMHGAIFLITDPLTLGNHLSNWRSAGLLLDKYEVRLILTDVGFDEFLSWAEDSGLSTVADPIFDVTTGEPVSGIPVISLEAITASDPRSPYADE